MKNGFKNETKFQLPDAYELEKRERLEDMKSLGLLVRHKKTGARIVVLSNEDDNKVFSIGFRTPPEDSTGVPHIIEHTVLCGSDKYPCKDPFVELVKGSLNTFLNAMTYPDKTIYPVASCNEKDFQNLMDVYLNAVFYPNIYKKEEIFWQEGWHYELEKKEDDLIYNGVVYNEMKGAFSSPEQILFRLIQKSLFPDTAYGVESGGDPKYIPQLTYEQFLAFHKKYYHPSNSYIYFYGDIDIEEKLGYLEDNYLSHFDKIEIDSQPKKQTPFGTIKEIKEFYSISSTEDLEDKTYLAYNLVIGNSMDRELTIAFQVLEYVLLTMPGAILKQALIDEGIGKDILSSYDNGILQPVFSIIAKNTNESQKEQFLQIIQTTLQKVVEHGLEEKSLQAAIHYFEFKYREADFGSYPKGLIYGLHILDSWLYDDSKPFLHMNSNEVFSYLKSQIGTSYYETLIQTYLLAKDHTSIVLLCPERNLTEKQEEEVKKTLANYKASLTDEQLEQIIENTKKLRLFQETPSTKGELEQIPLLEISDIKKEAQPIYNVERRIGSSLVLHHNIFTNRIGYIKILFDLEQIPQSFNCYLGLFSNILGMMNTKEHTYMELSNEINSHTGGISVDLLTFSKAGTAHEYKKKFVVYCKALYEEIGTAFQFIREVLIDTLYDDTKRLYELISENKSRLEMRLNSTGHSAAVNRSFSYYSESAKFNEETGGIEYYQFIVDLEKNFESKKEEIIRILSQLVELIFRKDNVMISFTAEEEGYQLFEPKASDFLQTLYSNTIELEQWNPILLQQKNEGFKTTSQVQYVARSGNYIDAGYKYTGALKVLKVILGYEYLWTNVRVKGGAYGCMCGFSYDGSGYFTSYRDPNLAQTNEVYENIYNYLKQFQIDKRDMTKYIIGAISSLDSPLSPSAKGARSLTAYLTGITINEIQKERDELLNTSVEVIRGLADLVQSVLRAGNICVIGNAAKIEQNRQLFNEIKDLFV